MITSRRFPGLRMLIISIVLLSPGSLWSQEEQPEMYHVDTIDTSADIFDDTEPMRVTLTFDIKKYQREKFEGEYMPVHFLYQFNDSIQLEKEMRLKARGQFRRNYCSLAPFWLNIRKADVANENLEDTKRMKIVTNCRNAKGYDEYLLKEYLCYKIYNIISPVSFRVRLMKMKYVDTGRKNKVTEGWAFMIEPEEMVAERHNALVIENDELAMRLMKPAQLDVAALFMYMIGNADFSVTGRHNIKILGMPGHGTEGYTVVPYDFDYSGLVDASYAIPGENLGIFSVRERYYLGLCRDAEAFMAAIEHINQYRDEILKVVNDFVYLDEKNKEDVIEYLEEYFAQASQFDMIGSMLRRTCR
ncbi:MAG: hypothetical protein U9R49_05835 [Bacteroidota bacterium]|nr:hypothetical protein [Bacteroidota bacterium]